MRDIERTRLRNYPRVENDPPNPTRRALLGATVAVGISAYIPRVFAAARGEQSAHDAFVDVSRFLTGQKSLDQGQAVRLYKALAAHDPQFSTHVQALSDFIKQHKPEPSNLSAALGAESPALAKRAHTIMTAWYLGVVGEGTQAQCVTYENALNAATVADVLRPPTYCYGPAGSWAEPPI